MRNVIVTGASRGLGLGIAQRLARDGFRVVVVARTETNFLSESIETARSGPGAIVFEPCDLSRLDGLAHFVTATRRAHGAIYGLVNNAGRSVEALLSNMSVTEVEDLVRLNTVSPMVLTGRVARAMLASGEGRIVNIGSIVAETGFSGLSVYAGTKAAMGGFTRSLARELGRVGVTVNTVAPGFVDTDLTRSIEDGDRTRIARRSALGRLTAVEDVASAVAFLMSDAANGITGTTVTVDAGATA